MRTSGEDVERRGVLGGGEQGEVEIHEGRMSDGDGFGGGLNVGLR